MQKLKTIKFIFVMLVLAVSANAGFWSSVAGGVVANSLSGQKNSAHYDAKTDEKKIQQVLSKLGFYNGGFDGNLNSFDTRSAIEEFQGHYYLDDSGVLNKSQKQDLLYMHDLIKHYKKEFFNIQNRDTKKLKKLYKAFDKLEKKLSKNKFSKQLLSSKFKKDIENLTQSINKLTSSKNSKTYKDIQNKILWINTINEADKETKTWHNAKKYCRNLSKYGVKGWRLPTLKEFKSVKLSKLKLIAKNAYWTSNEYNSMYSYWFQPSNKDSNSYFKSKEYAARCVLDIKLNDKEKTQNLKRLQLQKKKKQEQQRVKKKQLEQKRLNKIKQEQEEKRLNNEEGTLIVGKLMWKKCPEGSRYTGKACEGMRRKFSLNKAIKHASKVNYAGYNDWRVPTLEELSSIVDCKQSYRQKAKGWRLKTIKKLNFSHHNHGYCKHKPGNEKVKLIDNLYINGTYYVDFLSSTPNPRYKSHLKINFVGGHIETLATGHGSGVRLVRDIK
jgi:peptidoglycan hydrolase-like protein with peptidoglycan-binding domain